MNSTLAIRRVAIRVRRRRPPSQRELHLLMILGAIFSQTGWLAWTVAEGSWPNLLLLLIYPPMVARLQRLRRDVRRWEEHLGHAWPVSPHEWMIVSGMWLVEAALWASTT